MTSKRMRPDRMRGANAVQDDIEASTCPLIRSETMDAGQHATG
jgi:hypothetical protein